MKEGDVMWSSGPGRLGRCKQAVTLSGHGHAAALRVLQGPLAVLGGGRA